MVFSLSLFLSLVSLIETNLKRLDSMRREVAKDVVGISMEIDKLKVSLKAIRSETLASITQYERIYK